MGQRASSPLQAGGGNPTPSSADQQRAASNDAEKQVDAANRKGGVWPKQGDAVVSSAATAKRQAATRAKIDRDANPEPDQHNEGQPIVRQEDERGQQRSKFFTDCSKEHRASLQCIEENYENKPVCQPFFDAYKTCRREERERRLEENARKTGGQRHGFW